MATVTDLSDLVVTDPDGVQHRLGEVIDGPTILDIVRYYGCAPCRDHLVRLYRRVDEVRRLDGAIIAIGPAAPYQAKLLAERQGFDFPLLLDPDHGVALRVGMHRQSLWRFVFDLRAWLRWLKAFVRRGQGRVVGAYWETPAVLVVDRHARVRWQHLGRAIGDYPPIEVTLRELGRVASG